MRWKDSRLSFLLARQAAARRRRCPNIYMKRDGQLVWHDIQRLRPILADGRVVGCLQPRRVAAVSIAERVAFVCFILVGQTRSHVV
jgi:hypothetical protein